VRSHRGLPLIFQLDARTRVDRTLHRSDRKHKGTELFLIIAIFRLRFLIFTTRYNPVSPVWRTNEVPSDDLQISPYCSFPGRDAYLECTGKRAASVLYD
jgi:hypothetical protein